MKKLSLAQIDHIEKFIKVLLRESYYRLDGYEYKSIHIYAIYPMQDRRAAILRAREQKQKQ